MVQWFKYRMGFNSLNFNESFYSLRGCGYAAAYLAQIFQFQMHTACFLCFHKLCVSLCVWSLNTPLCTLCHVSIFTMNKETNKGTYPSIFCINCDLGYRFLATELNIKYN